jgi:hypothetical protein
MHGSHDGEAIGLLPANAFMARNLTWQRAEE